MRDNIAVGWNLLASENAFLVRFRMARMEALIERGSIKKAEERKRV